MTANSLDTAERKPAERQERAIAASEARYRALATASADVIYRMSPDWSEMRYLDGRGFLSDTPLHLVEPRGSWLGRYIHPEDQARVTSAIDDAIRGSRTFELVHRVIRADGKLGWTSSRAVPVLDDAGRVVEWVGTASDVTDREHAELALRTNEARYRALFDSIDEGVCLFERAAARADGRRDYVYLAMNPAMQALFGVRDLSGESIRDNFPDEVEAWYDDYDRVLATGESMRFERESGPQGVVLDMFVTRLEDGSASRLLAVMRDVTARKRAEAALRASEARSRGLIENLPGGAAFVVDENLRYELAGGEAFASAGLNAETFVGRTVDEVLEPALADAYSPHYRRALGGEPFELEHSSHGRTFLTRGAPLRDGNRVVAVAVSIDITERRRAQSLLRASDARYRTLVENVRDYAIFGLDAGGFITEWTAGAERVKGYRAEEVLGRHLSLFFTTEDVHAGAVERELAEATVSGRAERTGWRVRKGGERFWVNEVASAVRDEDGVVRGFTKISRDLTAQKRVEDERAEVLAREQDARREAERAMVLRDEFLAVISHELRTPLSAILLWSKMLRAGSVPPSQQPQALASIETSASAQKQLIEDLLDVSSMLSGKVKLSVRELALAPVIEAAVAAVQPMAETKAIRIAVQLEADELWARVDPDRLRQVLWNLVNNAVKFTPRGGKVWVRLVSHHARLRIAVEDTGQGIAPDFMPYVFERFRQQDASITRTHGGLGLGLAIARQLVELQGGTISVASGGPGRGAIFTVELPGVQHHAPGTDAHVTHGPASAALTAIRVLLVEDDAPTRRALHWLLEGIGAAVTAVASAEQALKAADALDEHQPRAAFDLLVSDIGLPESDGCSLLASLRDRPGGAEMRALALTAYARDDDRRRILAAGFDAYLAKPVEPAALTETVVVLASASKGQIV